MTRRPRGRPPRSPPFCQVVRPTAISAARGPVLKCRGSSHIISHFTSLSALLTYQAPGSRLASRLPLRSYRRRSAAGHGRTSASGGASMSPCIPLDAVHDIQPRARDSYASRGSGIFAVPPLPVSIQPDGPPTSGAPVTSFEGTTGGRPCRSRLLRVPAISSRQSALARGTDRCSPRPSTMRSAGRTRPWIWESPSFPVARMYGVESLLPGSQDFPLPRASRHRRLRGHLSSVQAWLMRL